MVFEDRHPKEEHGEKWIECEAKELPDIARMMRSNSARLITITGLDDQTDMKAFYHFDLQGELFNAVVTLLKKAPALPSIVSIYPNADLYERELAEMFNIKIEGHPNLKPLFLSKELQGKGPLRKDFKGLKD